MNPEWVELTDFKAIDKFEIGKERIVQMYHIGAGNFGAVFKGILLPSSEEAKISKNVAIKTISCENNNRLNDHEFVLRIKDMESNLKDEALTMALLDANHIVRLKGFCVKSTPYFVLMEYMEHGDLHSFLTKNKPVPERLASKGYHLEPSKTLLLKIKPFLQIAMEIADGMAYLESKTTVHRDLAARNCMVSSDFTVKIGDFGLSRLIDSSNYYVKIFTSDP